MATFFIIAAVVLLAACAIHWFAAGCCDLEDFFIDEYGWVTILCVVLLSLIVFGFIFWVWWIMLIITGAIAVIAIPLIYYFFFYYPDYDEDDENDEDNETYKTKYKCLNCGAPVTETINGRKHTFKCEFCQTDYTKSELFSGKNDNDEKFSLSDFETEYFEACDIFGFQPQYNHSASQIDRKYEKLYEKNYDCEFEENLEDAYDFFSEEETSIKEYLTKNDENTIEKKYRFYLSRIQKDGEL